MSGASSAIDVDPRRKALRFSALPFSVLECVQLVGVGTNETRSRMPVAAARRSSVRVDGFPRRFRDLRSPPASCAYAPASSCLRETGAGACLDHCRGQREPLFKGILGLLIFRILAPGGGGFLYRDHFSAHVTSSARRRASSISWRGVFLGLFREHPSEGGRAAKVYGFLFGLGPPGLRLWELWWQGLHEGNGQLEPVP